MTLMKLPAIVRCLTLLSICCALPLAGAKEKEAQVPDVSLESLSFGPLVNEADFDPKALAGKVVILDAWGVNCGPCIALLPDLQRMAKSGEKKGLVVVGVERQNSSKDAILAVLKKARVTYPVVSGGSIGVDFAGLPHAAVYGVDGKLRWHGSPNNDGFKRAVREALREVER
jgi:thiol-disulfide isomerase/thioredoxin